MVVVIEVTDGAAGVLPNPKVTGGVTGVRWPRSSPRQDAVALRIRCWCFVP